MIACNVEKNIIALVVIQIWDIGVQFIWSYLFYYVILVSVRCRMASLRLNPVITAKFLTNFYFQWNLSYLVVGNRYSALMVSHFVLKALRGLKPGGYVRPITTDSVVPLLLLIMMRLLSAITIIDTD